MPRVSKKLSKKKVVSLKQRISSISTQGGDSYKSLLYGIATVVVLFILGFSITRLVLHRPQPAIDDRAVSTVSLEQALKNQEQNKSENSANNYKVQQGDTLWSIAEIKYGSGFEWYKIANANKITDVTALVVGMTLTVPQEENSTIVPTRDTTDVGANLQKIPGNTYVIQHGDDLWGIAVRAYGDGYKWVDIARTNNLTDPNLIHGDNVLKIPR